MDRQNVTLSLPKHLIRQARHVAVERGVSLSKLLSLYLEELVRADTTYEKARNRAIAMMRRGIPMGVGERPTWTREELHAKISTMGR